TNSLLQILKENTTQIVRRPYSFRMSQTIQASSPILMSRGVLLNPRAHHRSKMTQLRRRRNMTETFRSGYAVDVIEEQAASHSSLANSTQSQRAHEKRFELLE